MNYRYLVAHRDDAVPRVELALHRLDREAVLREYEYVDHPFLVFFDRFKDVKASYKLRPNGEGLEITIDANSKDTADKLVADFLIGWNKQHNGLAVVVD